MKTGMRILKENRVKTIGKRSLAFVFFVMGLHLAVPVNELAAGVTKNGAEKGVEQAQNINAPFLPFAPNEGAPIPGQSLNSNKTVATAAGREGFLPFLLLAPVDEKVVEKSLIEKESAKKNEAQKKAAQKDGEIKDAIYPAYMGSPFLALVGETSYAENFVDDRKPEQTKKTIPPPDRVKSSNLKPGDDIFEKPFLLSSAAAKAEKKPEVKTVKATGYPEVVFAGGAVPGQDMTEGQNIANGAGEREEKTAENHNAGNIQPVELQQNGQEQVQDGLAGKPPDSPWDVMAKAGSTMQAPVVRRDFYGRNGARNPQDASNALLNFNEANLRDVLRTISELTGENFIISPGVNARVSILTSKPVSRKDVFGIFESVLDANGLSAVKTGSYYKIVPATSAKQKGLGVMAGKEADVPAGERMMNLIVPIDFVSANDVLQVLKPLISPAGSISNYGKANTLVITDTASNIKSYLDIINTIDADAFERMEVEFIPVKNVDVKTLHKELTDVLGAIGYGKETPQLALVPVERLNSMILFAASPELKKSVLDWTARLDTIPPSEGSSIQIYYVQNDKASNIKTLLEQIYTGKKQAGPVPAQTQPLPQGSPVYEKATPVYSPVNPGIRNDGFRADPAAGDDIRIYIYEPANALIVQASRSDYQKILATLRELDRIPKQVMIDAMIIEVKLDDSTRFGIQWSAITGNVNIQQNTGLFSTNIADPFSAISTPIGLAAPSGLSVFATDASKFFAAVQALASTGKIDVLSNPHIIVKNYEKASINVGSDEPVATQSTQTAVTGTTGIIQNIEYRKTGVLLTVTPQITEAGVVAMTIRQEVSDKSTDRTVGNAVYPSFSKREAETSIVVKDKDTVVIGGLIQERKDNSTSGIPLLSRVPLIGWFFRLTNASVSKTELVILLKPSIIANSAQAMTALEEMKGKLKDLKFTREK